MASGGVLLVGSVPLRSAEDVFERMAAELGDRVRQLPDGETGPRSDWIVWQYPVLSSRPEFEVGPPGPDAHRALPRLRVRDDESVETIRFDDLGYAQAAVASYAAFARRKRDGSIPAHCRFQVSLPDAAGADRRLRRGRGPEPDRAALRGAHPPRVDVDLRRHPARPTGDPVGHQLRVRHARRGHAGVVRRSAGEHRRAARPPGAEHPDGGPSRVPLLPRPRAAPPGTPLRRPAARRHRQCAVAEPRALARLGPPAGRGRTRRPPLLRDPRRTRPPAGDQAVPGPDPPGRRPRRRPSPGGRRAALRPRLRRGHRLRLDPAPPAGPRAVDRPAPRPDDPDRDHLAPAGGVRVAGGLGAHPRRGLDARAGRRLRHVVRQRRPPQLVPQPRPDGRGARPPAGGR